MTDAYPPFRLDLGGASPARSRSTSHRPRRRPHPQRRERGRVLLDRPWSFAALVAVAMPAAGTAAVVIDQTQRDSAGLVTSPTEEFSTSTYAIVSETVDAAEDGPDWAVRDFVGTVRSARRAPT